MQNSCAVDGGRKTLDDRYFGCAAAFAELIAQIPLIVKLNDPDLSRT
jgi:hypothetical protein